MKDNYLLNYCRYYKGEENITETDPDKQVLCKIEREWVADNTDKSEHSSKLLSICLEEYLLMGMKDFEKYDNIPLTLKALLFNRFNQYNERMDIEAFKKWYKRYYDK